MATAVSPANIIAVAARVADERLVEERKRTGDLLVDADCPHDGGHAQACGAIYKRQREHECVPDDAVAQAARGHDVSLVSSATLATVFMCRMGLA